MYSLTHMHTYTNKDRLVVCTCHTCITYMHTVTHFTSSAHMSTHTYAGTQKYSHTFKWTSHALMDFQMEHGHIHVYSNIPSHMHVMACDLLC